LAGQTVAEISYQEIATRTSPEKRLVQHTRTLFFRDDPADPAALTGWRALRELGRLGLVYETYQLALTQPLLSSVFGARLNDAIQVASALEHLANPASSGYLSGADLAAHFTPLDTTDQYWIRS